MSDKGWLLPDVIDPPTVCFQINVPNDPNHIRAFSGALLQLARWWNWERDDLKRGAPVSAVWARHIDEAMELWNSGGACNVPIDCAELEACLVTSQVMIAMNQQQFNVQQAMIKTEHEAYDMAWDGTNQSINPDAPNSYPATAQGELALCKSLDLIINDYIYRKLILLKIANGILSLGDSLLGALGSALKAIGVQAEGALVIDGRSVGTIATQTAINALEDPNAIRDVICCAKDALNGVAMDLTTWGSALSSCSFTPSTNEAIVRDFVDAEVLGVDSNFFLMIDTWTEVDRQLTQGVVYTCVCDGVWEWNSDFPNFPNIWIPSSGVGGNFAVYTPTVGWESQDVETTVGIYRRIDAIRTPEFTPTRITLLEMNYDLTKGTIEAGGQNGLSLVAVKDNDTQIRLDISFNGLTSGTNQTATLVLDEPDIKQVRVSISSSYRTSENYNGFAMVNSVRVIGEGFQPF